MSVKVIKTRRVNPTFSVILAILVDEKKRAVEVTERLDGPEKAFPPE